MHHYVHAGFYFQQPHVAALDEQLGDTGASKTNVEANEVDTKIDKRNDEIPRPVFFDPKQHH